MSERYSRRNLILWQKAQELAYEIIQLTKRLPNTWASGIIARQIIALATSIAANIAEGHGRFSIGAHAIIFPLHVVQRQKRIVGSI